MNLDHLVAAATDGNKAALTELVTALQDKIYYLALRMLVSPADAQDATQDILVKIITHLSQFRFESKFNTWAYRIAVNHLLTEQKILHKDPALNFALFQQNLEADLQAPAQQLQQQPDYQILLNELRISCTMAMLLCLKPAARMAYILGDILELDQVEASQVLAISTTNFRQQLVRARAKVQAFTTIGCGLVQTTAKCRCESKLTGAMTRRCIKPEQLIYATGQQRAYADLQDSLQQTQLALRTLQLQQGVKPYICPLHLASMIETLVSEGIKVQQRPALN